MSDRTIPPDEGLVPPASLPPARGVPPVRSFRDWVFALAVLSLGLVLTFGWAIWVNVRTGVYPLGVTEGGTHVDPYTGGTISVLSWQVNRAIPNGDDWLVAPPEMVFLTVASRWHAGSGGTNCPLEVVGRGQEVFKETQFSDDLPYSCLGKDEELGNGVVYQNFLIPERKLPEVRGLRPSDSMRFKQPPLMRPPKS